MQSELPFGVARRPRVANTKSALCCIDDHHGKSELMVDTWWSGEGFTLQISDDGEKSIQITWTQWDALKLTVSEIVRSESSTGDSQS